MANEQHVRKNPDLGKRIARLEKRVAAVYQRHYMRVVRKDRKNLSTARNLRATLDRYAKNHAKYKGMVHRLSLIIALRPKGKRAVYLTPAEFAKFRQWLAHDFRGSR